MATTEEFMSEFSALLKKYRARMTVEDRWMGYSECGSDLHMVIEFEDWEMKEVDLGEIFDPE